MSLPKIQFSNIETKTQSLVLGFFHNDAENEKKKIETAKGKKETPAAPKFTPPRYQGKKQKELDALLNVLKTDEHFTGKKQEVSLLRLYSAWGFPSVMLLGLGTSKKWDSETARRCGASLYQHQKKEKLSKVTLLADSVFSSQKPSNSTFFLQAFCEGYLLASYQYLDLKKADKSAFNPEGLDLVGMKNAAFEKAVTKATLLAKAQNFARTLGDMPGNHLTPTNFGTLVDKMSKERGMTCTILGRKELEKEKMGLIIGVAQGSVEEPRVIIVEYKGGKKTDKHVALVGKGITFDSGGISLKPADRMEDMKYDMMGAAAVAGTMQAIADLKLPINVTGYIAACENLPGGKAQKPGDVQRSMSGKTVEIINTDAEGRLVLADVLEYAQKSEPQAIIDFATLTGACVVAIGTVATGIFSTHSGLLTRVKTSAEATGEKVWELPLYDEYMEDLKSSSADIKNSGTREAGASKGAMFLKFFVDEKFPWLHCDIAGAAYHRRDVNYHGAKYASGIMVRLMAHCLENWKTLK